MMKRLILASLFLMQLFAMNSHAALFDDKEARKKILEIDATMNSRNQAYQTELAILKKNLQELEQRVVDAETTTKSGGLLDIQNQMESLKQEVARLNGEVEVINHNIELTQQRQKDLYGDIDARLRKLELAATPMAAVEATEATATTTPATIPAATTTSTVVAMPAQNTQEYQLLELANGLSSEAKYKDAFNAYDKFLKDYPNSALAFEATYGLGYTQYALKNYKSSIITQQKVLDLYPECSKVPDAMLNMANSQIQLGLVPGAKKTLRDLIAKFPNSELIPAAQKRLNALEAIK